MAQGSGRQWEMVKWVLTAKESAGERPEGKSVWLMVLQGMGKMGKWFFWDRGYPCF